MGKSMMPTAWTSWRVILAAIVVITACFILIFTQLKPPAQEREEIIANIIKNWQQAHPAAQRFVILPDFNSEAVFDKDTGLIWEISPRPTTVTWNEARGTCMTRTTGGQKGWRLPAPAEMRSLVGPAVDSPVPHLPPGHPFSNIQPTSYWTVVPEANQPSYARYVDAFLGNVLSFIKIYTYPVWCVRGPIKLDGY
jgi:Protein of unknown function (DUF1566)